MTETDELRRMFDERGVEWSANYTYRLLVTSWNDASGHSWVFVEHRGGSFSKLTAYHLTPAQVVEATLGRGTCKWSYEQTDDGDEYDHKWVTSCGWEWDAEGSDELRANGRRYCPHCGGRIVKEDE